ncbi:MAG: rod shape-determining protein MreD [Bacteroidota bacterium]
MNRENLNIAFVFIGLVVLQIVILNNINFLGYINPFFYIVFIFYYPVKKLDAAFLLVSFLLGLTIDFFSNSGGVNAAATLFVAYIRIPVIKSILGKTELEFNNFSFRKLKFNKTLLVITTLTFIHHFIIFGLEYFKLNNIQLILTKTFLTSIFTIILILISFILFTNKNAS